MGDAMLWFLPQRTKTKFHLASSSVEFCELFNCKIDQLPSYLQDLEAYEAERYSGGVTVNTQTEDGHQQYIRYAEVSAGAQAEHSLDIHETVESVSFNVT